MTSVRIPRAALTISAFLPRTLPPHSIRRGISTVHKPLFKESFCARGMTHFSRERGIAARKAVRKNKIFLSFLAGERKSTGELESETFIMRAQSLPHNIVCVRNKSWIEDLCQNLPVFLSLQTPVDESCKIF